MPSAVISIALRELVRGGGQACFRKIPRGAAGKFADRHGEDRQRRQHAGTDHGDEARLQRADHAGCFGMR